MMTKDKDGNYIPWVQPRYGFDAQDVAVVPPKGHRILAEGEIIEVGDMAFDVYSGWLQTDEYAAQNGHHARSSGRWTTWARKSPQKHGK